MKIEPDTHVYHVSTRPGEIGHVSRMTFEQLVTAYQGGMKASDGVVFTDRHHADDGGEEEAEEYGRLLQLRDKLARQVQALHIDDIERLCNELEENQLDRIVRLIGA